MNESVLHVHVCRQQLGAVVVVLCYQPKSLEFKSPPQTCCCDLEQVTIPILVVQAYIAVK